MFYNIVQQRGRSCLGWDAIGHGRGGAPRIDGAGECQTSNMYYTVSNIKFNKIE